VDEGKYMIHEQRRKERSKEVKLQFVTNNNFNVLDDDGNMKYSGNVIPGDCSCPSFIHGNPEKYESSHPDFFQCKHLMRANELKKTQDKAEARLRDSIIERKAKQVLHGKLPDGWNNGSRGIV